ncbi:hypothetical protein Fmac_014863 [Flemingia macrophylla]|uniref:Uncharacterized protein n=1 Tax=Flemingia macrophylla TaxID=520843 RepID=A0ABD1MEY7_9FABA
MLTIIKNSSHFPANFDRSPTRWPPHTSSRSSTHPHRWSSATVETGTPRRDFY